MVLRKHNQTAGFSLIEVLVAITILGLVVVPIGSSLVLSFRLNARSGDTLQAQLAVSSAVETIMAEGYDSSVDYKDRYPELDDISFTPDGAAYHLLIKEDNIEVSTYVRPAKGGDES